MLKKRLIFTLLYDSGSFMLSRNFRLQRVGDINWLQSNYNFSQIACFIDELIVLDVTRGNRNISTFCEALKTLTSGCFVPISAGGGVRSVRDAQMLLRSGADKIVLNTPLFEEDDLVKNLSEEFGQQCLVGSIDIIKVADNEYSVITESGKRRVNSSAKDALVRLSSKPIGELYLNSIDQDGTGQGYDLRILELIPDTWTMPIILAGGVGNANHLAEGFADSRVDAVATANLFNFIGDGLQQARELLVKDGYSLAVWPIFDKMLFKPPLEMAQK